MTVETDLDRAQYATNATTGPWTVPYYFLADDELAMTWTDASGVDTLLVLNVDYTVAGAGSEAGGTITTTQAYPAGGQVVILRNVAFIQPTEYQDGDSFPAKTHERALDRLTMLAQQLREISDRTLRFAPSDSNSPQLPSAAARANTILAFDSDGNIIAAIPSSGSAADVLIQFADTTSSNKNVALIGWPRASAGAIPTTLKSLLGWQEISAFEFMTVAQIAAVQAGASPDLSAPLQAWINACVSAGLVGRLPKGSFKYTTTPQVNGPVILRGHGVSSGLVPQGCHGLSLNADHIDIEDMGLYSYSALGAADPRAFMGIVGNGVSGTNRNYLRQKNLYMQGWNRCISWQYTWQSQADRVVTVNSNVGIDIFGQSVNNHVDGCDLVVNGGVASIQTRKDGAIQGEGLFVSDTLMASGQSAILSDGFLSIGVDPSCMADLIQGKAFNLTGVTVFKCEAQWVYSNDSCFYAADLGSAVKTNWGIDVSMATCAGSADLMYWGSNNNGLKLGGHIYLPTGTGYAVNLNGGMADVYATISNGTANAAVRVNSLGNTIRTTGDRSVEWDVSPVTQVGNAAALTLPRGTSTVFQVVGTTNITSIAAANWAGLEVTLIFQGVLTVTDGSNLKLNGNFVTTADDVLKLACDGTNWFEISRSAN